MNRAVLAVVCLLALAGCDDGLVRPLLLPFAKVDPSVTELVELNDAGQAVWNEDGRGFFWDGSRVLELPFRSIDLGPEGGVVGGRVQEGFLYWKDGELTELPGEPHGFDAQNRIWINGQWWTLDAGFVGEAPFGGGNVKIIGEDGAVFSEVLEGGDFYGDSYWVCYRATERSVDLIDEGICNVIVSATENGLVVTSGRGSTLVRDTRTDPWTEHRFEFGSLDMNERMIFVATEGEVKDAEGNVLKKLDAVHAALINDHDEVLLMSPTGLIGIIE